MSGEFQRQARPICSIKKHFDSLVLLMNQPKIAVEPEKNSNLNSHPVFLCLFSARFWNIIIFIIFKIYLWVEFLWGTISRLEDRVEGGWDRIEQNANENSFQNVIHIFLKYNPLAEALTLFSEGKTFLGLTFALSLLYIVLSSLAFFGAAKEILCLVSLWIVLLVLEIVGFVIWFIVICIQFHVAAFPLFSLTLIHVFFLILAIKFRKDVEQNRSIHP